MKGKKRRHKNNRLIEDFDQGFKKWSVIMISAATSKFLDPMCPQFKTLALINEIKGVGLKWNTIPVMMYSGAA